MFSTWRGERIGETLAYRAHGSAGRTAARARPRHPLPRANPHDTYPAQGILALAPTLAHALTLSPAKAHSPESEPTGDRLGLGLDLDALLCTPSTVGGGGQQWGSPSPTQSSVAGCFTL